MTQYRSQLTKWRHSHLRAILVHISRITSNHRKVCQEASIGSTGLHACDEPGTPSNILRAVLDQHLTDLWACQDQHCTAHGKGIAAQLLPGSNLFVLGAAELMSLKRLFVHVVGAHRAGVSWLLCRQPRCTQDYYGFTSKQLWPAL